jgi:hypothetical protein
MANNNGDRLARFSDVRAAGNGLLRCWVGPLGAAVLALDQETRGRFDQNVLAFVGANSGGQPLRSDARASGLACLWCLCNHLSRLPSVTPPWTPLYDCGLQCVLGQQ